VGGVADSLRSSLAMPCTTDGAMFSALKTQHRKIQ
jgi:hypothetical protein